MRYQDFEACIFDFDGVIIDSEPLHAEAKRATLDHFGVPYSSALLADFKGRTDKAFFEFVALRLAAGVATAEEMDTYKRAVYLQLFQNVSLIPGAQSFLTAARRSFRKLGLATSATRRDFGLAERKYQLANWFDVVVTGEDTSRHKPDPEPYLNTLAALEVAGPKTLVVEDSPNGIQSAKLAQCRIAALTTAFQVQELYRAGADVVVATFTELGRELGIVIPE